MRQKLEKILAHILNECVTCILLVNDHVAKGIVKLHETLIFELVQCAKELSFILQLAELLIIGVGAINIQNRQVCHSLFLQLQKMFEAHLQRTAAEDHRSGRLSISCQFGACRLDVAMLPSQREDQLLERFGHIKL